MQPFPCHCVLAATAPLVAPTLANLCPSTHHARRARDAGGQYTRTFDQTCFLIGTDAPSKRAVSNIRTMKNTLETTAYDYALRAVNRYASANNGAFNRAKIAKEAKEAWQSAQNSEVTREQSTALFNAIDAHGAATAKETLASVQTWTSVKSRLKLNRAGNEVDGYAITTVTATGKSSEVQSLAKTAMHAKEIMQAACRKFLETTADKRTERQMKRFYAAANDVQWLAAALTASANPEDNSQGVALLAAREHCYAAIKNLELQLAKV